MYQREVVGIDVRRIQSLKGSELLPGVVQAAGAAVGVSQRGVAQLERPEDPLGTLEALDGSISLPELGLGDAKPPPAETVPTIKFQSRARNAGGIREPTGHDIDPCLMVVHDKR